LVSVSTPSVTLPVTVVPFTKVTVSDPEPVLMLAVIAVPFAVS